MNLFVSILATIASSTICVYLTNKVKRLTEISSHEVSLYEEKFEVYKNLYLGLNDPFGRVSSKKERQDFLIDFCKKCKTSDRLFLLLSPKLLRQLYEFKKHYESNEDNKFYDAKIFIDVVYEIDFTIQRDFSKIKLKLGYTDDYKYRIFSSIILHLCITSVVFFFIALFELFQNQDKNLHKLYVMIIGISVIVFLFSLFYIADNRIAFYYKKSKSINKYK